MAGALPQTPNTGQSRVIDWSSGHGVEPHLQITVASFAPFVAKYNSFFSVSPCLCVRYPPRFTTDVCKAENVICGSVTHYGVSG